jgi:glycine cleavage system H protein
MLFPDDLAYTVEHEWVRISGRTARVGITDHAQDALGDVVYVQLPDLDVLVEAGDAVADIESTKSVSAIYAPLSGVIAAVNDALSDAPELVNTDPYGEGWIFELQLTEAIDPTQSADLLDAAEYQASLS